MMKDMKGSEDKCFSMFKVANRVLLGLLMLIPGLLKVFVMGPANVTTFFAGAGIPLAGVAVWVVIVAEIVCGLALLANWQVKWAAWPPVVIMLVAAFLVYWTQWPNVLLHIAAASNFAMLASSHCTAHMKE